MSWWWNKQKPVADVTGTHESVKDILIKVGCSPFKLDILDRRFIFPSDMEVLKICRTSGVRNRKYIPGKFDCEEFSYMQLSHFLGRGMAFGCAHIRLFGQKKSHMVNIYINNQLKVKYIEPQNGTQFDAPVSKILRVVIV